MHSSVNLFSDLSAKNGFVFIIIKKFGSVAFQLSRNSSVAIIVRASVDAIIPGWAALSILSVTGERAPA